MSIVIDDTEVESYIKDGWEYVMDYQVESQRGGFLFGYSLFSSDTLMPTDPKPYTDLNGDTLGYTIEDYQVPNTSWQWVWSTWYVDMSSDVDNQGWTYSWRFGSSAWHGRHLTLRSFVRQRRWKRVRRRKLDSPAISKLTLDETASNVLEINTDFGRNPSVTKYSMLRNMLPRLSDADGHLLPLGPAISNTSDLASITSDKAKSKSKKSKQNSQLQKLLDTLPEARNDREKSDLIVQWLNENPEELDQLQNHRESVLRFLSFPVSVLALRKKLEKGSASSKSFANNLMTFDPSEVGH